MPTNSRLQRHQASSSTAAAGAVIAASPRPFHACHAAARLRADDDARDDDDFPIFVRRRLTTISYLMPYQHRRGFDGDDARAALYAAMYRRKNEGAQRAGSWQARRKNGVPMAHTPADAARSPTPKERHYMKLKHTAAGAGACASSATYHKMSCRVVEMYMQQRSSRSPRPRIEKRAARARKKMLYGMRHFSSRAQALFFIIYHNDHRCLMPISSLQRLLARACSKLSPFSSPHTLLLVITRATRRASAPALAQRRACRAARHATLFATMASMADISHAGTWQHHHQPERETHVRPLTSLDGLH